MKEERKRERVNKLEELVKKVTALRNSKGGILLVHITGLDRGDRFLGYFDEFVDEKLNKLIEDGKQFVDTYSRVWLSDELEFAAANSFVCLTVKSSSSVSTTDFKTKIPLDSAIENPSTTNILSLLAQRRKFSDRDPQIRGNLQNLAQLNESRNVQLKAFLLETKKREELLKNVSSLCDYIWRDLRLREYISAFTKVESGGSFFLGIEEKELGSKHGDYFTKIVQVHGVPLPVNVHGPLKDRIVDVVNQNLLICNYDGEKIQIPNNFVEIVFHNASEYTRNNSANTDVDVYVVEVSVKQTTGIVFYESSGPKSFRLVKNRIVPVDGKRWFRMIRKLTDIFKDKK